MRFLFLIATALILPACSLFDPGEVVVSGRAVDAYTGEAVAVEAVLGYGRVFDTNSDIARMATGPDGRFEFSGAIPELASLTHVLLTSEARTLFPLFSDTAQPAYFSTRRSLKSGTTRLGDVELVPAAFLVAHLGRPLSVGDSISVTFVAQRDVLGEQTATGRSIRLDQGQTFSRPSDFVAGNTEATVRWEYFPVAGPPQSGEVVVYCPRDEKTEVAILE